MAPTSLWPQAVNALGSRIGHTGCSASAWSQKVELFRCRHSAWHSWHLFQRPSLALSSLQSDPCFFLPANFVAFLSLGSLCVTDPPAGFSWRSFLIKMFFQGNPVHPNRRDQFALPLSQDGSTRPYCPHLSFITFSMRNTSSEMPFPLHCRCLAMVVLLIGQKNIFWV